MQLQTVKLSNENYHYTLAEIKEFIICCHNKGLSFDCTNKIKTVLVNEQKNNPDNTELLKSIAFLEELDHLLKSFLLKKAPFLSSHSNDS